MLGRYSMVRGMPASKLPKGSRQDTRKHTKHVLRPNTALVEMFLSHPGDDEIFARFREGDLALRESRWKEDRAPFEKLAREAEQTDVWLGCNCPTAKNPLMLRCHTLQSLGFMHSRVPNLSIQWP